MVRHDASRPHRLIAFAGMGLPFPRLANDVNAGILVRLKAIQDEDRDIMLQMPMRLLATLRAARHVVVLTGAGVSVESGLSTFRTPQSGLWERFDAEELATPRGFKSNPALVWGWYEWRRMQALRAVPNEGHLALKRLAEQVPQLTLITQNVDDLNERAGSAEVLHLHGSLHHPMCNACRRPHSLPPGIPEEPEGSREIEPLRCGHCGGRIRPGVVWFGETLPQKEWSLAKRGALACDLFLETT